MQWATIQYILGILLMAFSATMLPPIGVSLWYGDGETIHFLLSLGIILVTGIVLWLPVRGRRRELRTRSGFVIVTLFWTVLGMLSAIPFLFNPHLAFSAAVFESVSGFTTTGATVISGLDQLPPSILYYRQQLQWLGGMGVIVLAVAIIPLLGVGGMQLFKAETPGPMKDEKLTPRIAHTARTLWLIYVMLTVACALAFWLAGMSGFDAIAHSFTAVSTGGFSPHDASMGYFDSPLIEAIADVFMLLGAINFAVHFTAWRGRTLRHYVRDSEVSFFLVIVAGLIALVTAILWLAGEYANPLTALRYAAFQVISIITSTGFTTASFADWPSFLPILLIYISFIGGCAGSTAGGMKVIRVILLLKQGLRELTHMIHPKGMLPIKIGDKALDESVTNSIWAFFSLYVFSTATLTLVMVWTGLDVLSAYSAVAACLNVLGPGLGEVAGNFSTVSTVGKWILIFTMLLGRLELFTLLVLLTPMFWRK